MLVWGEMLSPCAIWGNKFSLDRATGSMSIAWNPGPGSAVPLAMVFRNKKHESGQSLLDSLLQLPTFWDVEVEENQTFDHLLSAPRIQKIANKLWFRSSNTLSQTFKIAKNLRPLDPSPLFRFKALYQIN